jgi:8-oxo-dGTP diphosphatase
MTVREIPPPASIWAAGCIVARMSKNEKPEYLIVHRPRYDDWSLPKGKLNKRESFRRAAIRETREETGIRGRKPRFVGTVAYMTKAGNPKVVRWWLVKPGKGSFKPNSEVDRVKWLTYRKARSKLAYRNDRAVLDRAHDMVKNRSAGTIFLVRHALAGTRVSADPEDWRRPLDKQGRKQRRAIEDELMAHPVTRIGSSNFTRCVETVEPFAKRLGIPIEPEASLIEGSHPERLITLINELRKESAVLCSHGDVIANVIGTLAAQGVPLDGPAVAEKGSIWHLRTIKGRVVSGTYLAP